MASMEQMVVKGKELLNKGLREADCRILSPAYLGLIRLASYWPEVHVTGKEKLKNIEGKPIAIWANHTGDSDIFAIARIFDALHVPFRDRYLVYSDWHFKHGSKGYKEGIKACKDTGWTAKGVRQRYRDRLVNPNEFPKIDEKLDEKAPEKPDKTNEMVGIIKNMLEKSSFVFPTGTRSKDGKLLPAEEGLGAVIYQAAKIAEKAEHDGKPLDNPLYFLPMAIVPRDVNKKRLNLQMNVVIGDPLTPQQLVDETRLLAKQLDIDLTKDRGNKRLCGLIAHAFMMHIPVPEELKGVYDSDQKRNPHFKEVLKGEIVSGMRQLKDGYDVILVKQKPNSNPAEWIPVIL